MPLVKRVDPLPLPPQPFVVSTTGTFDGDDGKWSTFFINLGDDNSAHGQNFKIVPSTSSPLTQVPAVADWCNEDCAKSRGLLLFGRDQPRGYIESTFWKRAGIYNIPLPYWWSNGITSNSSSSLNATWGTENVGLGESSSQSYIIPDSYVARYGFKDFFLGSLGLAAGATGSPDAAKQNFLDSFYGAHWIASLSYGYTAGAWYRNDQKGVLGSLVLGGYDKSRSTAQGVMIDMPNDKNNSLVVGVQSVLYTPDSKVEANSFSFTQEGGFSAAIDSTLPYLILPDSICDRFQDRFQLQFDPYLGLYTINDTAHNWNRQQNATVSFKIGKDPRDSSKFASIELPYLAFYQQLSSPISRNSTQQYFPIKKSNNGIYVLGRTFLQEAYITVDYERSNFSIAPTFYSQPMPNQNLVTIFNKTYTGIPHAQSSDSGLGAGAIAGIVIGIVLAFIIAGAGAFFWWRRRRNAKDSEPPQYEQTQEIETTVAGDELKHRRISELTGSEGPRSSKPGTSDLYPGDRKPIPPISEMSPDTTPAELYSPPPESASDRDSYDYFAAGRRRRARGERDSIGKTTPGTPIAELPGDGVDYSVKNPNLVAASALHSPAKNRGQSDTSLSTNIDEVFAGKQETKPAASTQEPQAANEAEKGTNLEKAATTTAGTEAANASAETEAPLERRPSHGRGLSDSTIKSDATAVSQPSADELEQWARSGDQGPARPLSPPVDAPTWKGGNSK